MNLLIHKLPTEVNKNIINTDFRISILFELLIQDRKVPNNIKILKALELYYPNFKTIKNYNDVVEAIEGMLWFYQCGKALANSNKENRNNNSIIKFIDMSLMTSIFIVLLWSNIK